MHQRVDANFNNLANVLVEAKSSISPPVMGVGKRCYITVTLNEPRLGVEFYAETVVNSTPDDPAMGFTWEDLNISQYVAIYVIEPGDGEQKNTYGEVISFDDFLDKYVTDARARVLYRGTMARLEEEAMVKEAFLDRLNNIWQERDIHRQELYDKRFH